SSGFRCRTVKVELLVLIVYGVVLLPQTSVPVCKVTYLYAPLYVTVVVAPLTIAGDTRLPSIHRLIDPSTTVVEPSSNTILTGELVSAPAYPLEGTMDFTCALSCPVRKALTAFGSAWLTRILLPVLRSTVNHSRFAPPTPCHQSSRKG